MVKKKATAAEREHMDKIANMDCIIYNGDCAGHTIVHHKTNAGMGLRASHFDTMPICWAHHDAQTSLDFGHSVHKGTKVFEKRYGTQAELLKKTNQMLEGKQCTK
jgi:hypothetical protein